MCCSSCRRWVLWAAESVARHTSHVTRHTSHLTPHTLQVLLLHVKRFALRDDKIVKISQPLQVAPLLQVT